MLPMFTVLSNYLLYIKEYRGDFLIFFNQVAVHCMGPLIFIYCLLMMGKKIEFGYKVLSYFSTVIIPIMCWICYIFYYSKAEQIAFIKDAFNEPLMFQIMNFAIEIQFFFFLSLSLYAVRKHNKAVKECFSESEKIKLAWLNEFVILMLGLCTLMIIAHLSFPVFIMELYVLPILSNIFYFYIIYQSFNNSVLFNNVEFSEFQTRLLPLEEERFEKYMSSAITSEQLKVYSAQVKTKMEVDKLFLNPELNMKTLSHILNIPSYKLSEVINRHFNQNFFDMVNTYRVQYAQEKLNSGDYKHYTLEAVAEECGFGSKTSFNRAFKKHTGHTPSQFAKTMKVA